MFLCFFLLLKLVLTELQIYYNCHVFLILSESSIVDDTRYHLNHDNDQKLKFSCWLSSIHYPAYFNYVFSVNVEILIIDIINLTTIIFCLDCACLDSFKFLAFVVWSDTMRTVKRLGCQMIQISFNCTQRLKYLTTNCWNK